MRDFSSTIGIDTIFLSQREFVFGFPLVLEALAIMQTHMKMTNKFRSALIEQMTMKTYKLYHIAVGFKL